MLFKYKLKLIFDIHSNYPKTPSLIPRAVIRML
ncbi:hypothetical protein DSM301R_300123 [Escherichia coli]|nr:hypothetical protein AT4157R_360119 [Escherichia coli]SOQ82266.1 hypothetical protein DSM301R_300123 [Escherichia coli]SOQ86232.1 hypothetical protein NCTC86R_1590122 [Escherichia coli]SOQ90830.1 hypothetical protein NC86S1_210119 [Escherichia coli]